MLRLVSNLQIDSWKKSYAKQAGFNDGFHEMPRGTSQVAKRYRRIYDAAFEQGKNFWALMTGDEVYTEEKK